MKVLFVITKKVQMKQYFLQILEWLQENDYEVHIACDVAEEIQYCNKLYIIPFNKSKLRSYKILKRIIRENDYDLIHCYSLWGGIITRLITKNRDIKIIYTVDSFKFYRGSSLLSWIIYYPIEKYLSRFIDTLIIRNEEDYILAKNKFKHTNIELINDLEIDNNISISEEKRQQFLEEYDLSQEDYICASCGELNATNNQILQIEAIMQILPEYKNIKLLIIGEGKLEDYYNNIIQKYGLDKNIILSNKKEDLSRIIYFSDCILSTCKRDREMKILIKAMMANKPIIASRIKEYTNLLEDDNLIDLNNANELIDKLEKNIISGSRLVYYNTEKYQFKNIIDKMKKIYI